MRRLFCGVVAMAMLLIVPAPAGADTVRPSDVVLSGSSADRSVVLSWTGSTDDVGVDHYEIWITDDGVFELIESVSAETLTYVHEDLQPGETHAYRLYPIDGSGNYGRSNYLTLGALPAYEQPRSCAAKITAWRPVGSRPLSDADAAARVCPAAENRPANARENAYRPSASAIDAFRHGQKDRYGRTAVMYNPRANHVTGGFTGTTDEILQWAAHKWGIPEDLVRAVAANESAWNMSQLGDRRRVSNPYSYPSYSRVSGTSYVYQSLGIMQVKWTPEGMHQGTEPLRWRSTAFNADYWGAVVRYYYDGLCDWCGSSYRAGQGWNSIGAWYNPSPWATASDSYRSHVSRRLSAREWKGY